METRETLKKKQKETIKLRDEKYRSQTYVEGNYGFITMWNECVTFAGVGYHGPISGSEPYRFPNNKVSAVQSVLTIFANHKIPDFDIRVEYS